MNATLTHWLQQASDRWADWMWHLSWQVCLLVVVLTLITWALRGQSARLRHAMWLLVLIRLILPPTTAFPTGYGWWFDRLHSHTFSANAPDRSTATTATSAAGFPRRVGGYCPTCLVLEHDSVFVVERGVSGSVGDAADGLVQVRSWVARAPQIDDPVLLQMLRNVQDRIGLQGHVELRNSEACATPLVVGWWRPVVLLPRTVLEQLSLAELETVLVHELVHVKRGDGWLRAWHAILENIYFFHPAVWWSSFQLRTLREDACDEATVAVLGRRKDYGSALVKAAEILGYAPPPLALGILDSSHPISHRVHRILDPSLPVEPVTLPKYAFTLILGVLVLLPAGPRPAAEVNLKKVTLPQANTTVMEAPAATLEPETLVPASSEENAREPQPTTPQPTTRSSSDIASLVAQLVDPVLRHRKVLEIQSCGADAESDVLQLIAHSDTDTRIAAYEVLAVIGSERSADILADAYLKRTGTEQFAAQRAMNALLVRQRANPHTGISHSPRLFVPKE